MAPHWEHVLTVLTDASMLGRGTEWPRGGAEPPMPRERGVLLLRYSRVFRRRWSRVGVTVTEEDGDNKYGENDLEGDGDVYLTYGVSSRLWRLRRRATRLLYWSL